MAEQRPTRNSGRGYDIVNTVLCVAMIVLAIIAFTDVQRNRWLFVPVFANGAIMSILSFIDQIKNAPRGKKNWLGIILSLILTIVLAVITFVSYRVLLKPFLVL